MTKRKAASEPAVEAVAPARGGAFIRLEDGTLVRDQDEDQHVPDDELSEEDLLTAAAAARLAAEQAEQAEADRLAGEAARIEQERLAAEQAAAKE